MKKVVAILASPRKGGNCELIAKEISRQLSEPHQLELLRLAEFDIKPCTACYRCLFLGRCVLKDDYPQAVGALVAADALIVAVPTYFLGPNSLLKTFLDRGMALNTETERLWGTPAVGVGIAGIPGKEGYTRLGLESFLKLALCDVRATAMLYGALPGEVLLGDEGRQSAKRLADALEGRAADRSEGPSCPVCGGVSIRFLGNDRVQCLLCSNAGTIQSKNGVIRLDIQSGGHELFATLDDATRHFQWLKGMKSRFKEKIRELKELNLQYEAEGHWVTPGSPVEKVSSKDDR